MDNKQTTQTKSPMDFESVFEATELRNGVYAIKPKGRCGTCGYHPFPWTVQYYKARSAKEAMHKFIQNNI